MKLRHSLQAGCGLAVGISLALAATSKTEPREKAAVPAPVEVSGLEDPITDQSWGLHASASARSWTLMKGSRDIIVAVIDTGADLNHPDLRANLWKNAGESGVVDSAECRRLLTPKCRKETNGIDDDGNGFIDDIHGWNFVSNSDDLTDRHGHGTHIAGIVGAVGGNGTGLSGVAPEVSLMILKYYDPHASEEESIANTVNAIDYAVKMGAQIINYSAGGLKPHPLERAAIERARARGVLFVAAAGNESSNSDLRGYYPADYGLSNILSVTAVDPRERVLASSNYGTQTVRLAAPGEEILSTLPGGRYGYMTGTSQATAFASGAAAMLLASDPHFIGEPERIIEQLVNSGRHAETLRGKTRHGKLLNAYAALVIRDAETTLGGFVSANAGGQRAELFARETWGEDITAWTPR